MASDRRSRKDHSSESRGGSRKTHRSGINLNEIAKIKMTPFRIISTDSRDQCTDVEFQKNDKSIQIHQKTKTLHEQLTISVPKVRQIRHQLPSKCINPSMKCVARDLFVLPRNYIQYATKLTAVKPNMRTYCDLNRADIEWLMAQLALSDANLNIDEKASVQHRRARVRYQSRLKRAHPNKECSLVSQHSSASLSGSSPKKRVAKSRSASPHKKDKRKKNSVQPNLFALNATSTPLTSNTSFTVNNSVGMATGTPQPSQAQSSMNGGTATAAAAREASMSMEYNVGGGGSSSSGSHKASSPSSFSFTADPMTQHKDASLSPPSYNAFPFENNTLLSMANNGNSHNSNHNGGAASTLLRHQSSELLATHSVDTAAAAGAAAAEATAKEVVLVESTTPDEQIVMAANLSIGNTRLTRTSLSRLLYFLDFEMFSRAQYKSDPERYFPLHEVLTAVQNYDASYDACDIERVYHHWIERRQKNGSLQEKPLMREFQEPPDANEESGEVAFRPRVSDERHVATRRQTKKPKKNTHATYIALQHLMMQVQKTAAFLKKMKQIEEVKLRMTLRAVDQRQQAMMQNAYVQRNIAAMDRTPHKLGANQQRLFGTFASSIAGDSRYAAMLASSGSDENPSRLPAGPAIAMEVKHLRQHNKHGGGRFAANFADMHAFRKKWQHVADRVAIAKTEGVLDAMDDSFDEIGALMKGTDKVCRNMRLRPLSEENMRVLPNDDEFDLHDDRAYHWELPDELQADAAGVDATQSTHDLEGDVYFNEREQQVVQSLGVYREQTLQQRLEQSIAAGSVEYRFSNLPSQAQSTDKPEREAAATMEVDTTAEAQRRLDQMAVSVPVLNGDGSVSVDIYQQQLQHMDHVVYETSSAVHPQPTHTVLDEFQVPIEPMITLYAPQKRASLPPKLSGRKRKQSDRASTMSAWNRLYKRQKVSKRVADVSLQRQSSAPLAVVGAHDSDVAMQDKCNGSSSSRLKKAQSVNQICVAKPHASATTANVSVNHSKLTKKPANSNPTLSAYSSLTQKVDKHREQYIKLQHATQLVRSTDSQSQSLHQLPSLASTVASVATAQSSSHKKPKMAAAQSQKDLLLKTTTATTSLRSTSDALANDSASTASTSASTKRTKKKEKSKKKEKKSRDKKDKETKKKEKSSKKKTTRTKKSSRPTTTATATTSASQQQKNTIDAYPGFGSNTQQQRSDSNRNAASSSSSITLNVNTNGDSSSHHNGHGNSSSSNGHCTLNMQTMASLNHPAHHGLSVPNGYGVGVGVGVSLSCAISNSDGVSTISNLSSATNRLPTPDSNHHFNPTPPPAAAVVTRSHNSACTPASTAAAVAVAASAAFQKMPKFDIPMSFENLNLAATADSICAAIHSSHLTHNHSNPSAASSSSSNKPTASLNNTPPTPPTNLHFLNSLPMANLNGRPKQQKPHAMTAMANVPASLFAQNTPAAAMNVNGRPTATMHFHGNKEKRSTLHPNHNPNHNSSSNAGKNMPAHYSYDSYSSSSYDTYPRNVSAVQHTHQRTPRNSLSGVPALPSLPGITTTNLSQPQSVLPRAHPNPSNAYGGSRLPPPALQQQHQAPQTMAQQPPPSSPVRAPATATATVNPPPPPPTNASLASFIAPPVHGNVSQHQHQHQHLRPTSARPSMPPSPQQQQMKRTHSLQPQQSPQQRMNAPPQMNNMQSANQQQQQHHHHHHHAQPHVSSTNRVTTQQQQSQQQRISSPRHLNSQHPSMSVQNARAAMMQQAHQASPRHQQQQHQQQQQQHQHSQHAHHRHNISQQQHQQHAHAQPQQQQRQAGHQQPNVQQQQQQQPPPPQLMPLGPRPTSHSGQPHSHSHPLGRSSTQQQQPQQQQPQQQQQRVSPPQMHAASQTLPPRNAIKQASSNGNVMVPPPPSTVPNPALPTHAPYQHSSHKNNHSRVSPPQPQHHARQTTRNVANAHQASAGHAHHHVHHANHNSTNHATNLSTNQVNHNSNPNYNGRSPTHHHHHHHHSSSSSGSRTPHSQSQPNMAFGATPTNAMHSNNQRSPHAGQNQSHSHHAYSHSHSRPVVANHNNVHPKNIPLSPMQQQRINRQQPQHPPQNMLMHQVKRRSKEPITIDLIKD